MSTKFYTLLTDIGAAKLASAAALGVPLKITHMAVGDGGGVLPTPDSKQTALVNEKRRAALNMLYIDPQNSSQIIAEQVIPENEGGWWIREVGLFDESGALIAVGNCPESYKPQLAEGSGRTQTVRMVLITSSTDNITLKIDPAVVLATRKYVDDKISEHEQSRRHPDASLTAKGFTQLSSATNSESEILAATPKAVKAAYDLAAGKASASHTHPWNQITGVPAASLTVKGIVQLSSATNSTSETQAATPKAVKAAYDLAAGKAPVSHTHPWSQITDVPAASLTVKGTVQLSSATNSTSETQAATPKAVKAAYDLAAGKAPVSHTHPWSQITDVPAASLTVKGTVQLSSATNSTSETLAATPKAVKSAYDNAEKRLQKDQNGADIPDKRLFLRNIGATNSTTMSFSGGTGWFRLATVTMPQASSVVYISLIGGAGYNVNSPMQAGISELVLRAGNGNPKDLTGALWRRTSVGFTNFAWVNTSGDTYDVYVEIGNYATGVNIQWDYTSNASVTIHTSPTYTANKPTGLTDGTVYVIYSSHIKPTAADLGLSDASGYVGRLVNTRVFTSSGTYTPTPGTKRIRVTITGGGGGGGGCKAISNNETFFGAGGGAGGTVITILTPIQNSYPVTIGAGGAGGVGATNGLKGGDSSFGSVIAPGGEGGGKVGVTNTNGGNGGVPNIGDIRITGGDGGDGQSGNISVSGEGGTSYWGGGGRAGAGGGVRGRAFGSGGGGAYDAGYSGTSMTGGKGADGVCIIEEFA
ncbi:TPA: tail fiber protein [Escherichia coli]|uniref:tail fiber protein n=6 Tax=Escherichia coli TaxID=562 RepID=UPI000E04CAD7|nr:tail fiber protein [Escherichia coli]EFI7427123.1 phage tail protein [Escherichia coli]EGB4667705.1 phage tail protein [Escherichia coli]EKR9796635.1 tail fiber protein [Escherichia coli]MCC9227291.1 tail fiber protein [Escherichia coli]STG22398.1 putative tail fiber protein (GpH) [Escherichia coli]